MKHKLYCLLMAATLGLTAFAGSKPSSLTLDNVKSVYIRSSGPIFQNNEVKGYFFFYETDMLDRKTRQYSLNITDEFLQPIKEVKLVDDANVSLLESSFDGSSLVFLFYNPKEDQLVYRMYGLDGKEIRSYSKALDKKDKQMLAQTLELSKTGTESTFIKPLTDKGFLSLIPIRDGKEYSWEMSFYGAGEKKQWAFAPDEGLKFSSATFLGNTDEIAILEVLQRDKLMSKDNESRLFGIDLAKGTKKFDVSLEQDGYKFLPMNTVPVENEGGFLLFGQYYDDKDRVGADQSKGLFLMKIDKNGKAVQKKYLSWENDLSKFVNVNSKGKVEDIGFLFCHKIIPTAEGGYVIVAEGYKRAASALGIANAVLTQSYSSVTKIVVTDLVWIEVKPNFTISKMKIYNKNKNNIEMAGADMNSAASLAWLINATGGFDYSFTQEDKVNGGFTVGYTDYEKSSGSKGMVFNSISYFNTKVTTDKVSLTTKGAKTYVYPAKPGNVMIMEYVKKEKKLDLRFEKLN